MPLRASSRAAARNWGSSESLAAATTAEAVRDVFAGAVNYTEPTVTPVADEIKSILEAIRLGVEALGKAEA